MLKNNHNIKLRELYLNGKLNKQPHGNLFEGEVYTHSLNEVDRLRVRHVMKYILKLRHTKDYDISISRLQTDFGYGYNSAFRLIKYFIDKSIIIQQTDQPLMINRRKINIQDAYAKKRDCRSREVINIKHRMKLNKFLNSLDD